VDEQARIAKLVAFVGSGRDDASDVAKRHDHYFAKAIADSLHGERRVMVSEALDRWWVVAAIGAPIITIPVAFYLWITRLSGLDKVKAALLLPVAVIIFWAIFFTLYP
jgi:hypothetical protein